MLADIVPVDYDPDNFPHGGSNGATMRFPPETDSADNSGLEEAIAKLDPIYERFFLEGHFQPGPEGFRRVRGDQVGGRPCD